MVFNKEISGYKNEAEFSEYLNGKKIGELHPIFRDLFEYLYKKLDDGDIIHSKINFYKDKYDIIVRVRWRRKRISIKKGVKNSVHVENIKSFDNFLKENKIPRKIRKEYLRFHFADGSLNGTGKIRSSVSEYKKKYANSIEKVNSYINKPEIVKKAIERFIIRGRDGFYDIDVLIFGVVDDFIWISSEGIRNILLEKCDKHSSTIHFSDLTVQPMNRCLNRNPKYEDKRFWVQVKWYNIADNIIEYMNKLNS